MNSVLFASFDSFDIVEDTLGLVRKEFPHTVYFMAGTQVSFICFVCIYHLLDVS